MLEGFQHLSKEEIDTLMQAPVQITALVAGADGEIDPEERNWTDRLMRARTYSQPNLLQEYYRVVSDGFLEKVDKLMDVLPDDTEARNTQLAEQLEAINPIMAKLDPDTGSALYKSFVVLAKEAAKASGGFLRIGAVSAAEHQWVKLPMLTPITHEEDDLDAIWDEEEQD